MKVSCDLSNRCFSISLQILCSVIYIFSIIATGFKKNLDCVTCNALYLNQLGFLKYQTQLIVVYNFLNIKQLTPLDNPAAHFQK